jgi:phage terminase small subunit
MTKIGRPSYTANDIVPFGTGNRRLRPPGSVGEAEKAAFVDLVSTCPVTQFQSSDLPLLVRWCELTVMAEQAAERLRLEGMVTENGKVSPWFSIHAQATKGLNGLALRLRLGPQSRAPRAPKRAAASMSYYDQMELMEGVSRDPTRADSD